MQSRKTFFPKADVVLLPLNQNLPPPESRPTVVAPVLDVEHVDKALDGWSVTVAQSVYPQKDDQWAPAPIPQRAACPRHCAADRYLFPMLTRNERLRLTMLFYHTRGACEDQELMSRLQEKVDLVRETIGWEFVIAGLLNHNTYNRMVTVGLPLAILPRRESTCAHTINQPPGMIFSLLNMAKDWRFDKSPHVEQGGLRAYAGVPLMFETEFGEHVAFGSLCVASNSPQEELSKTQQTSLARLADWIVADIVNSAKARRQRERRRMQELLVKAQRRCDEDMDMTEVIPDILQEVYPGLTVGIHKAIDGQIILDGGTVFKPAELEDGLWEDTTYFDYVLAKFNHQEMISSRVIRVIAAQCVSQAIPTFLIIGCNDFRKVFDDVDSWFVHMCATLLCSYWQSQILKEALNAKETFLRGITHSLRTPIHGILGSVELLTEELRLRNVVPMSTTMSPSATPDVEQLDPYVYLRTIKTSARELISTVNSLIKLNQWANIAQAERHTVLHTVGEIETALLNETSSAMQDDVSERPSVLIHHHFPPNLDLLAFDLRLFLDSIQPLTTNGIQNAGGGVVAVTLSVSDDCTSFNVDVVDNGRGISAINHERIFNAYEKVDTHTAEAGLGLTLACKSALLMNGKISLVASHLGGGSHFRATFSDPVCASSFPPCRSIKERLVQLPPTFRRLSSDSRTSPLGMYFSNYLAGHGYTQHETSDGSFLVLDYTPNLTQLFDFVTNITKGQVAICLVPEAACFIDFDGKHIQRQDNVVYARGPFSSTTFEAALVEADAILGEYASSTLNSGSCPYGGIAIASTLENNSTPEDTATPEDIAALEDTSTIEGSLISQSVQAEFVQSVHTLSIEYVPSQPAKPSPPLPRSPMTLLVDDNMINLRLLKMYCMRREMPYQAVTDGQQAVDRFLEHHSLTPNLQQPFELVFMDLQMPVCDGIEATRQMRALEKKNGWKKSVICIITGQDSPSDRTHAEDAGADGYLVKPVGPRVLDRWVKQWFPDTQV
ncbi:Nn.00g047610.m01.CDS01 [Neocucurbitaria sp. VM-36]